MKMFRQIGAVTAMNFRSLPQRVSTSLVVVIGIAGVVAVLVSVLAMSTGLIRTMQNTGRDDRAIIMRNGAIAETSSALDRNSAKLIVDGEGIKRDADGNPITSAETMRILSLHKKQDDAEINVILRGVGPKMLEVRPELKIIEGRMFQPAVTEVIVGKAAHAQFKGLNVGDVVNSRGANWTVVGVFETGGDAHESSLMTYAETLISIDQRGSFQSVTALLDSPSAFQAFKDSLSANPGLAVDVVREREYYQQQSKTMSTIISVIAYVVGGIMAVGAVFAALNTMYSAVSARLQEIATLRALGFGSTAMVASVLAEALVLALIGGVIGALIAWLFFNGNTVSTSGGGMGQMVFELTVSPQLMILGIVWACIIGVLGGFFPAMRAARLPVAMALRAI
ncbi:ABC transporter permease [Steroidobacter cummioxidans]|uniref:ABC transporter permease n=1 Tax=Steroidobacter cummioxidans TaxID=1803913 RepID=UPI001F4DF736|nr:ABC transporter permease [Steroidobacter cummioxidans]